MRMIPDPNFSFELEEFRGVFKLFAEGRNEFNETVRLLIAEGPDKTHAEILKRSLSNNLEV